MTVATQTCTITTLWFLFFFICRTIYWPIVATTRKQRLQDGDSKLKNIINMALDIDHKFAMSSLLSISQRPLLRVIKPVVSTKNTNEHGVLYVHLDVGSCKALDGQSFFCHQQIITNTERQTQPDSNQTQPDEMKNVCLTLMGFCVI